MGIIVANNGKVEESASFDQMIIIEHVLEHTQAAFVLIIVLTNDDFRPIIRRLFMNVKPLKAADSDAPPPEVRAAFDAIHNQALVNVHPRKFMCWSYEACITGDELVTLISRECSLSRKDAAKMGAEFVRYEIITHVNGWHVFYDSSHASSWYHIGVCAESRDRVRVLLRQETAMAKATNGAFGVVDVDVSASADFPMPEQEGGSSVQLETMEGVLRQRTQPLMSNQSTPENPSRVRLMSNQTWG